VPPVLTAIKDQGACGSCWAHGTTEAIESRSAIQNGELPVLSQQQLVSCVPNMTVCATVGNVSQCATMGQCGGFFPNKALDWLVANTSFRGRMVEEWMNPYQSYWVQMNVSAQPKFADFPRTTPQCPAWMAKVPGRVNVTGYHFIAPANDAQAMENALVEHGPVIVVIAVYDDFLRYEHGIYSSSACEGRNGTMPPSHVVNVVGFGVDDATKEAYWIVRNSWSPWWGEHGYVRMSRGLVGSAPTCGTMTLPADWTNMSHWADQRACGQCGILVYGMLPDVEAA